MFGKKECKHCGEKVNEKSSYCPYCGYYLSKNARKDDFGMLGENDKDENELNIFSDSLFGKISGRMVHKMFDGAMKMLEKEMEREMKRNSQQPGQKTNFQLFINGRKINIDNINQNAVKEKPQKQITLKKLPQENLKNFSKLKKAEAETNVRRFSDKIIYEINMPGVKSEGDISIRKFENSIEIKAVAKDRAYYKLIPVNLPIINYNISEGKLVLELAEE